MAAVGALAAFLMILIGSADVVATQICVRPIKNTYELTEALLVILVFGGLSFSQMKRKHFRVEIFYLKMGPYWKKIIDIVNLMIGLVLFILLTWKSAALFWESWIIRETAPTIYPFPLYPAKLAMLLGCVAMVYQFLSDLIFDFKSFNQKPER